MKKIFVIVALLFLVANMDAQTKLGVKAGLNLSRISSASLKQHGETVGQVNAGDQLAGYHIGLYRNIAFGNHFGLQIEAMCSAQGNVEEDDGITVKENFTYVIIPILLDVKPIPSLSLFVGPQIGMNIYKQFVMGGKSISDSNLDYYLLSKHFKTNILDFSAVIGLQYTRMNHLTIGARYNIGLTPVLGLTDDAKEDGVSLSGGANRVVQISLGWIF